MVTYANGTREMIGGRTNLAKWSENFGNAAWLRLNSPTVILGVTDPIGGVTAVTVGTTSASTQGLYQARTFAAGTHTFSAWLRGAVGGEVVRLIIEGPNTVSQDNVLTTNWARYSVTGTVTGGSGAVDIYSSSRTQTFSIALAQLEPSSTPGAYIRTEADALEPGYPFLVRGSSLNADTNDPTPTLAGWVLDGVDDYGSFPTITLDAGVPRTLVATFSPSAVPASHGVLMGGSGATYMAVSNVFSVGAPFASDHWATQKTMYHSARPALNTWLSAQSVRTNTGHRFFINSGAPELIAGDGALSLGSLNRVGQFGANNLFFPGTISLVAIYSRALNQREVRQNHQYQRALMNQVAMQLNPNNPWPADFRGDFGTVLLP